MSASPSARPIGVFDSGIGGLTVVRALRQLLPGESIVYLGDTARVPYGMKSAEAITRFGFQDARFLLARDVKLVIVACHSVSSVCLDELTRQLPVPVVGVIEPGARAAVAATRANRVGVIGTPATITAGAYERAIRRSAPGVEIVARATPLFVPLVEEGWLEHPITRQVVAEYLAPLARDRIDALLLGCTHYPLLAPVIADFLGPVVTLVDSGAETAREAQRVLGGQGLLAPPGTGTVRFYLSDLTPNFATIGGRFLAAPLGEVLRATIPE